MAKNGFKNRDDFNAWLTKGTINVTNLFRSLFGKYLGTNLTGAEEQANAFTAQQNQEAMSFEERMADKQMAFQAEQAATEWQRGVKDMQAAGLNPALAYNQGGASAMQGASASGSAGSSVSPGVGSLSDIVQIAKLKKDLELADAEIDNRRKDIEVKDSQIGNTSANTELVKKQVAAFDPLNEANLALVKQELNNKKVQEELDRQGISESKAREALDINNAILSAMDAETRQELNTLNARLRVAEIAEAEGRVKRISAEITELYARAALHAASSDNLDQATKNLCVENGILKLDKQSREFEVDHQGADRNWRIAGQVINSVVGVAGVAVGAATGVGMMRNAAANTSINQARLDWQREMSGPHSYNPIGFR